MYFERGAKEMQLFRYFCDVQAKKKLAEEAVGCGTSHTHKHSSLNRSKMNLYFACLNTHRTNEAPISFRLAQETAWCGVASVGPDSTSSFCSSGDLVETCKARFGPRPAVLAKENEQKRGGTIWASTWSSWDSTSGRPERVHLSEDIVLQTFNFALLRGPETRNQQPQSGAAGHWTLLVVDVTHTLTPMKKLEELFRRSRRSLKSTPGFRLGATRRLRLLVPAALLLVPTPPLAKARGALVGSASWCQTHPPTRKGASAPLHVKRTRYQLRQEPGGSAGEPPSTNRGGMKLNPFSQENAHTMPNKAPSKPCCKGGVKIIGDGDRCMQYILRTRRNTGGTDTNGGDELQPTSNAYRAPG
ncbi:hypothetical protein B0H14DRAFT_2617697 [Mycena olivaceomarginata]|nr:hypothetical protein B0H14DRAFT_2617697 [Mycena olivaceomarginata]